MRKEGWIAAALILALILPLAPAPAASQQLAPAAAAIQGELSHVYNLLLYEVAPTGLEAPTTSLLAPGVDTLLLGGDGAYAILQVDPVARQLVPIASGSLVGSARIAFADSLASPAWYGFAQDSGEILLVNATNPSFTLTYYTATRTGVVSAHMETSNGETRLVAVDEEGYAYIYTAGKPYWLEIGPASHDAALASLPLMAIEASAPAEIMQAGGLTSNGELALLKINPGSLRYTGNATLTLYYRDRYNNTDTPAVAGTVTQGSTTITSTVYFLVSDTNGLVVWSMTYGTGGPKYNLTAIPAGNYTLTIIYQRVITNTTTNSVTIDWYTAKLNITIPPLVTVNLGLVRSLFLVSGDYTLEFIASTQGAYLPGPDTVVLPYLAVNLTRLNATTLTGFPAKGGSHWLTFLPAPIAATTITWYKIVKPAAKPATWPAQAEYLMVAGTSQEMALIYLLDANLTPVPFGAANKYYEKVYLAANPSSLPAVSPGGGKIFLGAESGYLLMLVWNGTLQRYIGANAYILDSSPVTSLYLDPANSMLFASSGSGIMQLIDLETWTPLWRGVPGFYGVDTKMQPLIVQGKGSSYIVGVAPGSGSVAVMYQPEMALYSISISLNITLIGLDGNITTLDPPPGTVATVLDAGVPVARSEIGQDGAAVFYLPPGDHTLNITMPGLGSLEKQYTLTTGISDVIRVGLRQYVVNAYTPPSIGDPKRDPGYYLVHGPKPGTLLTVQPYTYDDALGYIPSPVTVTSTTGPNGSSVVTIWDGVTYQIQGSLPGYTSGAAFTSLYGPGSVNLTMNPVLYRVTFNIYDNDTMAYGAPLYLTTASVSIVYQETGRNVTLPIAGQGDYYYLPPGSYAGQAVAPHYIPYPLAFTVPNQAVTLDIGLTPETYLLKVTAYQIDPTQLGIGNGPMSGAQVNITMVWPVPGMVRAVVYTGPDGTAIAGLRFGIYRVVVSHPYAYSQAFSVYLGNDTMSTTSLQLRTSLLSLYFKDSQFTLYGITNVTLTLSYQGSTWTGNYTVNTGNRSIITIEVPYGLYTITASAKYYETYTQAIEIAEESILRTIYMSPAMAQVRVQVAYSPMAGNLSEGPVQGALVRLKLIKPNVPTGNISAVTGPDGIAVFYVRQGVYDIIVTSKYTQPLTDAQVEIVGDTLIPEAVMPAYANISIQVLDAESSVLIPNVTLVITKTSPGVEKTLTLTLPNGKTSLTVPAGIYQVKATYPARYYEQAETVDLIAGAERLLTFSLQPMKGGLTVQVQANQTIATIGDNKISLPASPVPGANVTVIPIDPLLRKVYNATYTGYTGPDGTVELPALRSGTYKIVIKAPGYPEYEQTITVSPEAVTLLPVTLDPYTAKTRIAVIDQGLRDPYVKNYTLTIVSYNGQQIGASLTLPGPVNAELPTGTYTLLVEKDRYLPANITVVIIGGEPQNITVNLTPVTIDTTFSLNVAGVEGISGPVVRGVLELYPKDWDLAQAPINATVEGGTTIVTLRIGSYDAVLSVPALGVRVELGTVTIARDTIQVQLEVKPPTYNVQFNLMDADLVTTIYGDATLTLTYIGPFGTGGYTVDVANGTVTMALPPGNYTLTVNSAFYEPYTEQMTLTGPKSTVLVLSPVRVDVTLNLVDIDGNPVTLPNVTITIIHNETGEIIGAMLIQGKIIPLKGLRLGLHEITIVPPPEAPINTTRAVITVTTAGPSTNTITALPQIYQLTIQLIDPVTGGLAGFPFTIEVQRSGNPANEYGLPVTAQTTNGTLKLRVPYGLYTVTVKGGPDSYFNDPPPQNVLVDKDTVLNITLEPKTFKGQVLVTDDRNLPLQGALVVVRDRNGNVVATGLTDPTGTFIFSGVYGPYTITVTANGFKQGSGALFLPTQAETTIVLQPTPVTVLKRYSVLIIGVIGIVAVAAGLYLARGKILERLQEEEEYF